ncbi:MAG TPA: hypothetical protein VF533_12055 [Solirubrobacteraceae bacterium]
MSPLRPGLPSLVTAAAVAAVCLVLAPPALAGDPLTSIKINEVESEGVADFIELTNISGTATDASGLILKDSDDTRTLALPAGTTVPAGGFAAVDTDVAGGFGLGASDAARVFLPDGTTEIDGYSWTTHAVTSFGRCPDGTGAFDTTASVTEGAANDCPPAEVTEPWPGGPAVSTVDEAGVLSADVSGLDYESLGTTTPGVLWAVDNGNGTLLRLVWDGARWVRDTAGGWSAGKSLRYPGGTGMPDSEGVTLTDDGAPGGVFVSSERNLANNAVSRPSVLRYDVSGSGTTLDATREWDLTADLPPVAPNAGAESVEWVPDRALVEAGFVDQAKNALYDPAAYANHGGGLFFVGLEGNGSVYVYALDQNSTGYTRVASFASGFPTFGALHWDSAADRLWVVCDNNCAGRSRIFAVDAQTGAFAAETTYERPAGMANLNNEGFTIAPASVCVAGSRPVFWADDGNTDGHVLRTAGLPCTPPPLAPEAGWSGGGAQVRGDFDGDGFGDLAVGSPGEKIGGGEGAGMVQVFYGSAGGLTGTGATRWTQDTAGIDGAAEAGDGFGSALAAGDFDGDGRADLAIGAPGENLGAGQVHVLRGGAGGIGVTGDKIFTQGSGGLGIAEAGDHFGATLAAGRFRSAIDDLAVGAPGEDLAGAADAGNVHVLLGTGGGAGLTATGGRTWSQTSPGIADAAEAGDRFGAALATGNLDAGPQDELVAGAPGESSTSRLQIGRAHVIRGSASGLTATGSQTWTQDTAGVSDQAEALDRFGSSLVVADLSGSAVGELAIGVPGEDSAGAPDVGIVQILRGTDGGPTATGMRTFGESTTGIVGYAEANDAFGAALAAADLGGTPHAELIVGVPGESGTARANTGNVRVLPGSDGGTTATGSQTWSQDTAGIADAAEAGDRFGATLAASRFSAATSDVVIGVPEEDTVAGRDAGVVHVLRGAGGSPGLTATGSTLLTQATGGAVAQAGDRFGGGLGR